MLITHPTHVSWCNPVDRSSTLDSFCRHSQIADLSGGSCNAADANHTSTTEMDLRATFAIVLLMLGVFICTFVIYCNHKLTVLDFCVVDTASNST